MIEIISSWVKTLGLAVVVVSILEMLLPNNKTKKYIRMVMGLYIIFTMISPIIKNKDKININEIAIEDYTTTQTSSTLDQTSMDKRIQTLYIEQLEKDIKKKIEDQGYEVTKCKVQATISNQEEDTKISNIKVSLGKKIEKQEEEKEEETVEGKIVTEIQKIKKVETNVKIDEMNQENKEETQNKETKVTKVDIQNIKKFLMEEYGVSEKCLEIN